MTAWRTIVFSWALSVSLLAPAAPGWAQTASTLPPKIPERVVMLSALVRDARIAQRDCDIIAKRAALHSIQLAMRSVRLALGREAAAIARARAMLAQDGVALDALNQARSAMDAAEIVDAAIDAATAAPIKRRLTTLRNRYEDFDEWEILYTTVTTMLSRLDGAPADCAPQRSAASRDPTEPPCPPEIFAPCAHGRSTGEDFATIRVVVPFETR